MKTIRIISPAGSIDASFISGAADKLQSLGFHVEIAPHALGQYGRFAARAALRAADTIDALTDESVGLVVCSRGGYGLQQILPMVDEGVRAKGYNGAPVWGFSDITELHQLLALCNAPSFHAPMCKPLATLAEDTAVMQTALTALHGEALSYEVPAHPLNRVGKAGGVVRGGNLAVLCGLMGTPYDLIHTIICDAQQGKQTILFIEDVGEEHYRIDRMLHQLKMAGVFGIISGLMVGQFADCQDDPRMGCTLIESIATCVSDEDYPVCFGLPMGHVDDNRVLPLGVDCTLTVTKKAGLLTCSALPLGLEPRTP